MMKTTIYRTLSWIVTLSPFCRRESPPAESATSRVRVPLGESVANVREIIEASIRGDASLIRLPAMEAGDADAASYFNADGYHPNARGALYIADAVAAAIIRQPSRRLVETTQVEPMDAAKDASHPDTAPPTSAAGCRAARVAVRVSSRMAPQLADGDAPCLAPV